MSLTPAEAIVVVAYWPEKLSGEEMLKLLRHLTELDLPKEDLERWKEEAGL